MAAADLHSAVLEMFAGLEADERLAGQGLAEAFAEAFPAVPAASSVPSLTTSTSWARVAALLGVSSLDILDVTQNALKIPIPKIRACGGWGRRSQVPEDRYIDHMCRACDDARRFFGWLAD